VLSFNFATSRERGTRGGTLKALEEGWAMAPPSPFKAQIGSSETRWASADCTPVRKSCVKSK